MNNAEWVIQNGYKFINLRAFDADNANLAYKIGLRMEDHTWKWIGEVNKVYNDRSTAVFTWLDMEHVESILDDAERRYLSAVIRPFRNKIKHLAKHGGDYHDYYYEYITVMYYVDQVLTTYSFGLPIFPEGTMYKGMKLNSEYTLEELGL